MATEESPSVGLNNQFTQGDLLSIEAASFASHPQDDSSDLVGMCFPQQVLNNYVNY